MISDRHLCTGPLHTHRIRPKTLGRRYTSVIKCFVFPGYAFTSYTLLIYTQCRLVSLNKRGQNITSSITNVIGFRECDPHSHNLPTNNTYTRRGVSGMSHLFSLISAILGINVCSGFLINLIRMRSNSQYRSEIMFISSHIPLASITSLTIMPPRHNGKKWLSSNVGIISR